MPRRLPIPPPTFSAPEAMRMVVPVGIGGSGPFAFVVDTGSDRTVVSRELAAELGLAPGRPARMHSMAGVGQVATVVVPRLTLGGGTRDPLDAPALDEANLGARGLLGVDSLKGRRVVMDFRNGTFAIADGRTREPVDPGTIVVNARSRYGALVLVDADVGGIPITVIVDSGAQSSVGNLALRRMLERRGRVRDFVPTALIDVTGTALPADAAIVNGIRIGGFKMNTVAIAFADAHPFARFELLGRPAMLLGMDTLLSFRRVSVDFAQRKVRFLLPNEA